MAMWRTWPAILSLTFAIIAIQGNEAAQEINYDVDPSEYVFWPMAQPDKHIDDRYAKVEWKRFAVANQGTRDLGDVFVTHNPRGHFAITPPPEGCGTRTLPHVTAAKRKCRVSTNGGFFNTRTSQCINGIVADGRTVQLPTHKNTHFGLTSDGYFFLGYISEEMIKHFPGKKWDLIRAGDPALRALSDQSRPSNPSQPIVDRLANLVPGLGSDNHLRAMHHYTHDSKKYTGAPVTGPSRNDSWVFTQLVGGLVWLVKDGVSVCTRRSCADGEDMSIQETGHDFITVRSARTGIGFTKEGKLVMITINGKSWTTQGSDLYLLADLMIEAGAIYAVNLDGGGSTQTVVDGRYIQYPSDDGDNCKDGFDYYPHKINGTRLWEQGNGVVGLNVNGEMFVGGAFNGKKNNLGLNVFDQGIMGKMKKEHDEGEMSTSGGVEALKVRHVKGMIKEGGSINDNYMNPKLNKNINHQVGKLMQLTCPRPITTITCIYDHEDNADEAVSLSSKSQVPQGMTSQTMSSSSSFPTPDKENKDTSFSELEAVIQGATMHTSTKQENPDSLRIASDTLAAALNVAYSQNRVYRSLILILVMALGLLIIAVAAHTWLVRRKSYSPVRSGEFGEGGEEGEDDGATMTKMTTIKVVTKSPTKPGNTQSNSHNDVDGVTTSTSSISTSNNNKTPSVSSSPKHGSSSTGTKQSKSLGAEVRLNGNSRDVDDELFVVQTAQALTTSATKDSFDKTT